MTKPNTPQAISLASDCDNQALTGTRGWGKDQDEFFLITRKAYECPGRRILFARTTDQALRAPWTAFQTYLTDAGIPHNANEHNREINLYDATVVFGPLPSEQYFNTTWRGSSFVMIVLSEFSSGDASLQLKLISCLRDTKFRTSLVIDGNALGPSAFLLDKWFIRRAQKLPLGTSFVVPELGGMEFVNFHFSYKDNEFIDPVQYRKVLAAACGGEGTLQFQREEGGIYGLAEGSLFAYDDRARVAMPSDIDWSEWPDWHIVLAIDHGSSSPFAAVFLAEALKGMTLAPDNTLYPMGSRIAISAVTSALKDSGWLKCNPHTVSMCAQLILEEWAYLSSGQLPRVAVIDSQVAQFHGAEGGALLKEWQSYIPALKPVVKSPVANGCAQIATLLGNAQLWQQDFQASKLGSLLATSQQFTRPVGSLRQQAGLYIDTRRAEYLDHILGNVEAHPQDGDRPSPRSRGLLHGLDALRYGLAPKGLTRSFLKHSRRTQPTSESKAMSVRDVYVGPSGSAIPKAVLRPATEQQIQSFEQRHMGFNRKQLEPGFEYPPLPSPDLPSPLNAVPNAPDTSNQINPRQVVRAPFPNVVIKRS